MLNGTKKVIGLFGRDDQVETVVADLQEKGFGANDDDELQIIDEHRLKQETPLEGMDQPYVPQPGQANTGPAIAPDPAPRPDTESSVVNESARRTLTDLGLDDEAAAFHARHISRGSSLVIVTTAEERSAEAETIMKKGSGRVSVV